MRPTTPTSTVINTRLAHPSSTSSSSTDTTVAMASPTFPKTRGVNFNSQLVTSELRPLSSPESWALHHFENHARSCPSCHDPYARHLAHKHLCEEGHTLAQEVAAMLYATRDGHVYSSSNSDSFRLVRVEVPSNYSECHGLLRAIERCVRRGRRNPIVSMDRSYPVAPRVIQPELPTTSDFPRGRGRRASSTTRFEPTTRSEGRIRGNSLERSSRYHHYYYDDKRRSTRDITPSTQRSSRVPPVVTVEHSPSRRRQASISRQPKPSTPRRQRASAEIVSWPRDSLALPSASPSSTPAHSPALPSLSYSPSSSDTEDDSIREREAHERRYERRSTLASLDPSKRGSLYLSDMAERRKLAEEQAKEEDVQAMMDRIAKEHLSHDDIQPASTAPGYNVQIREPRKKGTGRLGRRNTVYYP